MPKQIADIKQFLLNARRKDARFVTIKAKANQTKFKLRCQKYLYTLVLQDREKAKKLKTSFPPSLKINDLAAAKKKKAQK
eukprot:CAMPEP_0197009042 /NCGR_PEP_ID=MMETSP1380-20130617/48105_1 /TAXON_ID=5936 /ORGANISM="Euplotes crassus, Strain CT5" /LENGTH=79 /DNA_ID=CAMNT_0042429997 /DNA_START=39 /DNA_END=278 /DNA_ORIENTATION=-